MIGIGVGNQFAGSYPIATQIAALFAQSQQGAWYDPGDFTTGFQDSAGATPQTAVEQPTGRRSDKSGRGNHAIQATAAARPVLRRDAGGYYYDAFDGSDDSLSSATGGGGTAGFFWCGAVTPTGGAGTVRKLWSDAGVDTGYRVRITAANQLEFSASNGLPIATPVQAATTTATTGGSLAAATYFYVVTALNALGETVRSNEQSQATTGATSTVTVSWAAITGATGYRIYRGTATGAQNVFYAVGAVITFTDTGAASTAGTPPLAGETAYVKVPTVATLDVGATQLVTVWDDGTNLNAQIGSGTVASIARPVVASGTGGFTLGKANGAATGFFTGNLYAEVYRRGSGLTATERDSARRYVASKAGISV